MPLNNYLKEYKLHSHNLKSVVCGLLKSSSWKFVIPVLYHPNPVPNFVG